MIVKLASGENRAVRVLVVEDEEAHAELARRAFEAHGKRYQVSIASNVKEAIALLARSELDLVLSDWRLPDGRGTDLFPEKQAPVPIVVMTSHGDEQVAVEVMKAGALDYVVKSEAAFGELPHVVERALREWQLLRDRERSRKRLEVQYEFISILARGGDAGDVFPSALASVARYAEAAQLELWMLDPPDAALLRFQWREGDETASSAKSQAIKVGEGWVGGFFESGQKGVVEQVPMEELRARGMDEALSAYIEPVLVDEQTSALLVIFGRSNDWSEHAEFHRFVDAVGAQLTGFLQRSLLHAQLLERQRLAGLGTAAAMFAHEVGNPLNSMYLHAQLLNGRLGKLDAPENVGQGMRAILDEIKRLTTLLEEFRSMSRKRPLALEEVDVGGLVTRVLDTHVRENAGAEISLKVDLPKTLPGVSADPDKLVQVFLNLCKNAVEAMTEGGTLSVHGRVSGKCLVIRIRDTGPGLPEGVDIFQLFKTTKPHGTGLGLPVVQQILAAHGGSVKAQNAPRKGAEFIVTLPVRRP